MNQSPTAETFITNLLSAAPSRSHTSGTWGMHSGLLGRGALLLVTPKRHALSTASFHGTGLGAASCHSTSMGTASFDGTAMGTASSQHAGQSRARPASVRRAPPARCPQTPGSGLGGGTAGTAGVPGTRKAATAPAQSRCRAPPRSKAATPGGPWRHPSAASREVAARTRVCLGRSRSPAASGIWAVAMPAPGNGQRPPVAAAAAGPPVGPHRRNLRGKPGCPAGGMMLRSNPAERGRRAREASEQWGRVSGVRVPRRCCQGLSPRAAPGSRGARGVSGQSCHV